jgi:hypothetical protein
MTCENRHRIWRRAVANQGEDLPGEGLFMLRDETFFSLETEEISFSWQSHRLLKMMLSQVLAARKDKMGLLGLS